MQAQPRFLTFPTGGRLLRTVFRTLWAFTVGGTAYAYAGRFWDFAPFGSGYWNRWSPRAEVFVATITAEIAGLLLLPTTIIAGWRNRLLCWLGWAALAF